MCNNIWTVIFHNIINSFTLELTELGWGNTATPTQLLMHCESDNGGKVVGSFLHAALSLVFLLKYHSMGVGGWGLWTNTFT